jgi:hypothetical protein
METDTSCEMYYFKLIKILIFEAYKKVLFRDTPTATRGISVYTVSSEGPASTSHSGIRTGDARVTRSLHLRSNHCAKRATVNLDTVAVEARRKFKKIILILKRLHFLFWHISAPFFADICEGKKMTEVSY